MSEPNKPATVPSVHDMVLPSVIVGVNDQREWNARITEMQEGLEFDPLIEFLERLKEPVDEAR